MIIYAMYYTSPEIKISQLFYKSFRLDISNNQEYNQLSPINHQLFLPYSLLPLF